MFDMYSDSADIWTLAIASSVMSLTLRRALALALALRATPATEADSRCPEDV